MLDKYCKDPLELLDKENRKSAIHLLNEMVTIQMEIIPEILPLYKDCTEEESWFQYASIPPVSPPPPNTHILNKNTKRTILYRVYF